MAKLRGTSFDDTLVRNAVIEFFKKRFNVELKSNEVEKKQKQIADKLDLDPLD